MMKRATRRHVLRGLAALGAGALLPLRAAAQSDDTDTAGDTTHNSTSFGPAVWMRIPTIGVDSHISEVGVVGGYYDVPWFDVGHHNDSANPGEYGNSIFNGHVVTINAGDVFRRLNELKAGDAVYAYSAAYRLDWVVTDVFSVTQDDNSFLDPTDVQRLTLYTCTGHFNPIERSYAERLVAVAQLVTLSVRTE
jgi:LPXTG-site transpeptidase (sortase) family protein